MATQNPHVPFTVAVIKPEQMRALMWRLATVPNGARIAAFTALNKAAMKGRTTVAKFAAQAMGSRISSINKKIWVKKASSNRLFAQIILSGNGVSLIGFVKNKNALPVVATVMGKDVTYPHAFIAKGVMRAKNSDDGTSNYVSGGEKQVFERQGDKRIMKAGRYKGQMRQPIVALKGPSVADTFENTPGLADEALNEIDVDFEKILDSQVEWLLSRNEAEAAPAKA